MPRTLLLAGMLGVGELALREVNSYCGGNCNPLDNAVEIATAPLLLAAASSYEVLSQMAVCPAAQGTSLQPAFFGPSFTLHGLYSRSGEMARLSLIPVDPSGNRGQPFALDVSVCANPNDQQSDIPPRVSPDEGPDIHSGGTSWAGCALHVAASRSAESSAAAIAAALLLFAGSVCRRRPRARQLGSERREANARAMRGTPTRAGRAG